MNVVITQILPGDVTRIKQGLGMAVFAHTVSKVNVVFFQFVISTLLETLVCR